MSVDGYIAGPNGEHDWIVMDPDIDFRSMFARFDTVLMGRKSFEASKKTGGGSMPGVKAYVFSRTLQQRDCKGATVSATPAETITAIKNGAGKGHLAVRRRGAVPQPVGSRTGRRCGSGGDSRVARRRTPAVSAAGITCTTEADATPRLREDGHGDARVRGYSASMNGYL
ncbi:MAG: dihydrofolate reductase family protein [Acidobacteria bacterium]|nr:dihydrofolate reductase family protein [Acidobacteriota bacterium]